jgi:DNA repair protein RecO (recombination protein O)
MAAVSSDAVILQAFKYSDTSKILRLITRSHGLQSVIAKGASRPKSSFGGVLEPFVDGVATFHARENRDLQTLTAFDLTKSRQGIGNDLVRFGGASLIAEIILRSGIEEPDEDLFESVRAALDAIQVADKAAVETVVLGRTWSLLAQLGFAPALEQCISCGRDIDAAEDVTFDYAAGGVRCALCSAGTPGRALPAHARAALIQLIAGEDAIIEKTEAHWRLLARFLAHHLLDGATLKSLTFLAETLSGDQ